MGKYHQNLTIFNVHIPKNRALKSWGKTDNSKRRGEEFNNNIENHDTFNNQ